MTTINLKADYIPKVYADILLVVLYLTILRIAVKIKYNNLTNFTFSLYGRDYLVFYTKDVT
jgi:hypothetical protein